MTETSPTKPWYRSRTIWASLAAAGAALAGIVGLPVEEGTADHLADAILQAVTAISAVLAILGRIAATSRIGRDVLP